MSHRSTLFAICASTLLLAGCGSMQKLNPFAEKDQVLAGERRPVFAPGSDFAGPRKLPPPNSDYVGATMPANQVAAPATPAPQAPVQTKTPTTGKKKPQAQVPEAPPLPQNPR